MKLFASIVVSTVIIWILMMVDLLLAGLVAAGIIIGILIRIFYIVDDIHKVLVTKEKKPYLNKNALERYIEERNRKEKVAQLKGE